MVEPSRKSVALMYVVVLLLEAELRVWFVTNKVTFSFHGRDQQHVGNCLDLFWRHNCHGCFLFSFSSLSEDSSHICFSFLRWLLGARWWNCSCLNFFTVKHVGAFVSNNQFCFSKSYFKKVVTVSDFQSAWRVRKISFYHLWLHYFPGFPCWFLFLAQGVCFLLSREVCHCSFSN